jgi:S1-C subfamily serine protease
MTFLRAATALLTALTLAACAGTDAPRADALHIYPSRPDAPRPDASRPDGPRPGTPAMLRVGFGTGFFVQDGVVATAAHVVRACRRIDLWSGAVPEVQASVQRVWRDEDVALLRVPILAPAALRRATRPARSGPLRAFGFPGAADAPRAAETAPVLVNAHALPSTPADPREILWLQDAAIGHGWSGGPVLDGAGDVAGIIVAVMPDPASAAQELDAPLPGIAIATGIAGLHVPPAASGTDDPQRAIVHVRCVE